MDDLTAEREATNAIELTRNLKQMLRDIEPSEGPRQDGLSPSTEAFPPTSLPFNGRALLDDANERPSSRTSNDTFTISPEPTSPITPEKVRTSRRIPMSNNRPSHQGHSQLGTTSLSTLHKTMSKANDANSLGLGPVDASSDTSQVSPKRAPKDVGPLSASEDIQSDSSSDLDEQLLRRKAQEQQLHGKLAYVCALKKHHSGKTLAKCFYWWHTIHIDSFVSLTVIHVQVH